MRGQMGRVVARLIECEGDEAVANAIHDLEAVLLSEPPASRDEAILMLQVVAAGIRAGDGPAEYSRAVEDVAAWVHRSMN